jgi:predicted aspartyl protease
MFEDGWVTGDDGSEYEVLRIKEALGEDGVILRGVMNPIDATDVANKVYVDDAINAAKEDFSEFITSEATEWKVVDGNGNIIFSVDANGAHTTSIIINGKTIQEMIREYVNEAILGGAW